MIARYEGRRLATACISTAISTSSKPGPAGASIHSPAWCAKGRMYGRGSLRHEGRTGRLDGRRSRASSKRHPLSGRARDLRHGRRGIGRLRRRRLAGRAGLVLAAARRPRDHPGAARRRPRLHRPSRRLVGRDRDLRPDRARLDAVSRRLRDPPHGRLPEQDRSAICAQSCDAAQTAMPVVPAQARQSTLNINAIHGGQAETSTACPARWSPDSLPPGDGPPLPARGGSRRRCKAGDHRHTRAAAGASGRSSATASRTSWKSCRA